MSTKLLGSGDNYRTENSLVIPALIRRFLQGKLTNNPDDTIWYSGNPRSEFLFLDDMAASSVFVMNLPKSKLDAHQKPIQSNIKVRSGEVITSKRWQGHWARP
jgi:GDP-L-fucose synthase